MQADMVLKNQLKALHLDPQATGDCVPFKHMRSQTLMTYFSQQGHTSSKKATAPKSATPNSGPMVVILFKPSQLLMWRNGENSTLKRLMKLFVVIPY